MKKLSCWSITFLTKTLTETQTCIVTDTFASVLLNFFHHGHVNQCVNELVELTLVWWIMPKHNFALKMIFLIWYMLWMRCFESTGLLYKSVFRTEKCIEGCLNWSVQRDLTCLLSFSLNRDVFRRLEPENTLYNCFHRLSSTQMTSKLIFTCKIYMESSFM